jgi:ADP-ribose pyrophosphatase
MSSRFERTASETIHEGGFLTLRHDTFRHEDGEEVERDLVTHPGAVGVLVLDDDKLWFVRQPREAVGSPDLLEIPAGKLDEEGEEPLATAKRELAEEIGKQAEHWEPLGSFYTSVGFTDEEVHLFYATGLSEVPIPETEEDERIEVVRWPLAELDAAIDATIDAKTLIGLMLFARSRAAGG